MAIPRCEQTIFGGFFVINVRFSTSWLMTMTEIRPKIYSGRINFNSMKTSIRMNDVCEFGVRSRKWRQIIRVRCWLIEATVSWIQTTDSVDLWIQTLRIETFLECSAPSVAYQVKNDRNSYCRRQNCLANFHFLFALIRNNNWNNNLPGQLQGSMRFLLNRSSNQSSQLSAQTEAYHVQFSQFKAIFYRTLNMFGNFNR